MLLTRVLEEVEELQNDAGALDDAERERRTADTLAAILRAERVDVALVDAARNEGRNIQYRENTDPRALLGLASELPAPKR